MIVLNIGNVLNKCYSKGQRFFYNIVLNNIFYNRVDFTGICDWLFLLMSCPSWSLRKKKWVFCCCYFVFASILSSLAFYYSHTNIALNHSYRLKGLHPHTHKNMQAYTQTQADIRTCIHIRGHTQTHTHAHKHTCFMVCLSPSLFNPKEDGCDHDALQWPAAARKNIGVGTYDNSRLAVSV